MSQQIAQQQAAQAGQSQNVTPTDIAAAVAQAMAQHMPQPQQQQPQLSQEQIDQLLGTYRPDVSIVHALFGPDPERDNPRLEALNQFVQNVVRNAAAQAQVISQDALRGFYPHIQQDLEAARYLSGERFYEDIYRDHDGLKHYDPVIRHMQPSFENMSNYPKDRRAQAEFVRNQFVEIMKKQDPNFNPKVGPSNPLPHANAFSGQRHPQQQIQQTTQQSQHTPSALVGALGGGGQAAAAQPQQAGAERSWDPQNKGLC